MNNEGKILSMLEQMSTRQNKTETMLESLVSTVDKLAQGQARIESEIAEVKAEVTATKNHVVIIENDLKLTKGALLGGYKQTYDIIKNEVRPDIADIKERQENQQLQITWLDNRSAIRKSS